MGTTTEQVTQLYKRMQVPLGIIYSAFYSAGYGPTGEGSGLREPKESVKRGFTEIPLLFGAIPGQQFGIFLGDQLSERSLYESYGTDRTAVIINVDQINKTIPDIDVNGVALLIAHELGHGFRWYLGHKGGNAGYTNEIWARMLELAYVEALFDHSFHARMIGVMFSDTVDFIKKYRKDLYRSSQSERDYYARITGDNVWPVTSSVATTPSTCPKGDPQCFKPANIPMLHIACKGPN